MGPEAAVLHIDVTDTPAVADVDTVRDGLNAYNARFAPDSAYRELAVFLRDADGRVRGGVTGNTYWGWLHIDLVWLEDELRGGGWGAGLLAAAEDAARGRGCRGVVLSTQRFQAPDFYRAHGYEVVGEIPDLPQGHGRIYMTKRLTPDDVSRT